MLQWIRYFVACFILLAAANAAAIDSFKLPTDPQLLERYQQLSEEYRCLVCQNQNLADSKAELAVDLKKQIVALLEDGQSDEQIDSFLVERYGDFVRYKPPFKASTLLLWLAPALAVLLLLIIVIRLRRSPGVDLPEKNAEKEQALVNAKSVLRGQTEE